MEERGPVVLEGSSLSPVSNGVGRVAEAVVRQVSTPVLPARGHRDGD